MSESGVWSIPLEAVVDAKKVEIDTVVRRITISLFDACAKKSPVDTGRFRANWNVAYGAPDASTSTSTAAGRVVTEVSKVNGLAVGGTVYMTNSLPYAAVLEFGGYPNPPKGGKDKTTNGYSKQAPAGMVRLTVAEFNLHVKAAAQ